MSDSKKNTGKVSSNEADQKQSQLDQYTSNHDGTYLTTNPGLRINHTDDSLKAGQRGPTLMEDFHLREKMTHFDHERIPERVVHARGSAAHGYFQVYKPIPDLCKAGLFQDPSKKTPVFVRFSTVAGFRGSPDNVRDVRGFSVKFYTEEGNWDFVGNNMPVFFIQDAIKFPDVIHAVKPEPHNEIPQASSAHDNFWDFISLMPESMHMIMWVMSDRALPRSYAEMEGFGVHTFRMIDVKGKSRFVKFHWKPVAGVQSLVWDENQKIAGNDPDFHRRNLAEMIEEGNFPEFELGVQVVEEEDEFAFGFDLLDPTKIIPEELVPVQKIGKMTLNRNPDNFFAETEQVAFHPGHVVPGIDFTNDPLLQGRLFSYIDTQISRLGGPNFNEIPINRPISDVHNNQRDGMHRQTIDKGVANYFPNTRGGGCPMMAPESAGGYTHHMERVEGHKIRERSDSFKDYFSQAKLFYDSMADIEKRHILDAFQFELSKVKDKAIRERMVYMIANIDKNLAGKIAEGVGVSKPTDKARIKEVARDAKPQKKGAKHTDKSPALSMENLKGDSIKGRKVAVIIEEGFDFVAVSGLKKALEKEKASAKIVSKFHGPIKSKTGEMLDTDETLATCASVLFDAIYIPGGADSVNKMKKMGDVRHFILETYKHCKTVGATDEATALLREVLFDGNTGDLKQPGVVTGLALKGMKDFSGQFKQALLQYRHWERVSDIDRVPA